MSRIAVGGILHETHTFAPSRTSLADFETIGIQAGAAVLKNRGAQNSLGGIIDGLVCYGLEPVPLMYASAMPGGTVEGKTYQVLLDRFLKALESALPLDGVALSLHGAMVAEGQSDCEGEILAAVRSRVGPDCPVVAVLDMHGNVSPRMVENADVLVAFHHNPHIDARERGLEAADLLSRLLRELLNPTTVLVHPPLILSALNTWTARLPLSAVHQAAAKYEGDERVLNISIMGGFGYADTPFSGVSVVVTTCGDPLLAQQIAGELAAVAWDHRSAALYTGMPPAEAVQRALCAQKYPVVLADVGDNIGGGTPGDGTVLLKALLEAGAQDAVMILADAEAAARAHTLGQGATLEMEIGARHDRLHGEPVFVRGIVERVTDGRYTISGRDHFANLYGMQVNMGPSAVIRCGDVAGSGGVCIIVTTHKTPPGDLNQLISQGIQPEQQKIIVVKAAVAFRGAYEPVAGEIIEVDTPGLCSSDLDRFQYREVPRPIFPLDDESHFSEPKI